MAENTEYLALWGAASLPDRRPSWPVCRNPRSSTGDSPMTTSPVPAPTRAPSAAQAC